MPNTLELIRDVLKELGFPSQPGTKAVVGIAECLVIEPSTALRGTVVIGCAADTVRVGMLLPIAALSDNSTKALAEELNRLTPTGRWSRSTDRPSLVWRDAIQWSLESAATDPTDGLRRRLSHRLRRCARVGAAVATALATHGVNPAACVAGLLKDDAAVHRERLPASQRVSATEFGAVLARFGFTVSPDN
jgi:hypothetical protein